MRNYIILNGKNSNEINGLLIQELPPISKPQIRTETEEIDGRDGDIVTKLGFAAYDKEISVGLYKDFDINEIIAYFNSEGTIVFSNEPDKYYNYQIIDQIDFERLVRYRTATIRMHCQPFKYSNTQGTITKDASDTVSDEGSNLVLENTAEAPFKRLEPKGNAEQKTLSGKNICSNATVAGNTSIRFYFDKTNSTNLVLSAITNAATNRASVYLVVDSAEIARIGNFTGGANQRGFAILPLTQTQIDTIQAGARSWLNLYVGGGGFSSVSEAQIEAGSSMTAYEPYCGGIPSPNPDYPQDIKTVTGSQTVKIEGKNLATSATTTGGNTVQVNLVKRNYQSGNYAISVIGDVTVSNVVVSIRDHYTYIKANATRIDFVQGQQTSAVFSLSESEALALSQSSDPNITMYKVGSGHTIGINLNAQLELGLTATDYEPYQGQEFQIDLYEPNLFDISKVISDSNSYLVNNGDGTLSVNGFNRSGNSPYNLADYCPNLQAGDEVVLNATTDGTRAYIYLSGSNYQWDFGTKRTITATDLTSRVGFYSTATGTVNTISNIRIAKPIELAKIPNTNYTDGFRIIDGTWYIHKEVGKVVLDGTEATWAYISGQHARFQYSNSTIALEPSPSAIGAVASDHFTASSTNDIYNGIDGKIGVHATVHQFWFSCLAITDLNDFKTWLSTHNTTVYYALATPTDTEITDSELIEQLEALAEAHSYKDRTHINATATGNNAPHIIAAEVGVDNESTVTNSGNINSKPVIKIYGSGNIGAYLNDIQILQIALGDEGYITIDTNLMEAYKDTLDNLKNRLVTGDYSKFSLKPGANKIHFSGTVTKYEISKYSRWL